MKKLQFILPVFITCLLLIAIFSCSGKENRKDVMIAELTSRAEQSDQGLLSAINSGLRKLEKEQYESGTAERAKEWYHKALKIDTLKTELLSLLMMLREPRDQSEGIHKVSDTLFSALHNLAGKVRQVDVKIAEPFADETEALLQSGKERFANAALFKTYLLSQQKAGLLDPAAAVLKNKIVSLALRMVRFCNEQVGLMIERVSFMEAIVAQSSKMVEPGGSLEITSGVGHFTPRSLPLIIINGVSVTTDETGVAHYKLKAPVKPGKYSIPVSITFTDQDGIKQSQTTQIQYTVARLCE